MSRIPNKNGGTLLLAPIYRVSLITNKILPKRGYGFARGTVRTRLVDAHDEDGKEIFGLRELLGPRLRSSSNSAATEGVLGKAGSRKSAGATSTTGGVTWRPTVLVAVGRHTCAASPPRNRHNCAATTESASFGHRHPWSHPRCKAAL